MSMPAVYSRQMDIHQEAMRLVKRRRARQAKPTPRGAPAPALPPSRPPQAPRKPAYAILTTGDVARMAGWTTLAFGAVWVAILLLGSR